ncbi:MAG: hypothetical protein DRN12_00050 [Thermoplasmata archaeon]|nr:MAG: hypothetical protein DRN12_00050 [Thermoplasmata archaeon]
MNLEIKELALRITKSISRKIRSLQSQDINLGRNIGIGADGTPTEYIDKIAEDVAIRYIRKSKIPVNLLSEESGYIDMNGEYTLVLDPIDGTRNAIRGIPFYATSLAIGRDTLDSVEYGIVLNIPTGDIFIAEKERGAYFNNKQIFTPDHPSNSILSSLNLGRNVDDLALQFVDKNNVRSLGAASLEMSMVAIGAIDFYIMGREYLRVTDIAASILILREAGGIVRNRRGYDIDMPLNLDERTSIIAACSESLIDKILNSKI